VAAAVVADEEHQRVVLQALVVEALEQRADLAVDQLHLFETVGPIAAAEFVVRVIRWQLDILGVDRAFGIALPRTVRAAEGDTGEERLTRFALVPVGAGEQFRTRVRREVAVGFPTHDGGEITGLGEQMRDRTNAVRQRLLIVFAVLVGADVVLVEAGHHRRT